MKKYCTKCGKPFDAIGREVICPACKEQAAAEAKHAAVLKAKRASWTGESVPVRISGRASTVIREYGAAHNLPFAAALDALLRTTDFFLAMDKTWVDVTPYKSHRRDKTTATSTAETAQEAKQVQAIDELLKQTAQEVQDEPVKPVKTAAKAASKATSGKASASKAAGKATKTSASTSKASKASK